VAQVIVRNLDDRAADRLKRRAKLQVHSLEQELREIRARAARPTKEERVALSRRARAMTPPDTPQTDSVELLRQDRRSR
jgi:plasmid stability protein